jgi:hypothetical protein
MKNDSALICWLSIEPEQGQISFGRRARGILMER